MYNATNKIKKILSLVVVIVKISNTSPYCNRVVKVFGITIIEYRLRQQQNLPHWPPKCFPTVTTILTESRSLHYNCGWWGCEE